MNSRTGCIRAVFALVAAAVTATPAFATGTCVQDEYNSFNGTNKTLSCTANDVSLATASNVVVFQGGLNDGSNKCIAGSPFSFTANFAIKTTSSSARSNIGVFFAGAGQTQAKTGTCSSAILAPVHSCAVVNGVATGSCGSSEYEELDQSINGETAAAHGCGDTSSADGGGTGIQHSVLEVDNVTCPTSTTAVTCPAGSGATGSCLALNYCTSWYQPANGMPVCESPTWSWVGAAIPGTSSKCDCSIVYIPVQPITPSISVSKACNIGGSDSTSCALGAEGGTVTYKVSITDSTPAGQGGVILDQICDNRYGTVYRNSTLTTTQLAACDTSAADGIIGSIDSGSFACTNTTTVNGQYDIANGQTAVCSFTVAHGENLSVTDTATVYTQSDTAANTPATPQPTNTVTVTSSDAPTTAKTSSSVEAAPGAACVTARFDVTVRNTSLADESVTLNSATGVPALNETKTPFGNISALSGDAHTNGSVLGTTCGVAVGSPGLGTLSGVNASTTNGGAYPATLNSGTTAVSPATTPPTSTDGGTYSCKFDGVVCGTPAAITGTTCAYGLSTQISITPNLTGDDVSPAPADVITVTANTLTANICLAITGS